MSYVYDTNGRRKYLTLDERRRFLEMAVASPPDVHTFCATLAFTGARISEVLALTPERIDLTEELIVIECLKKRRTGVYRVVPVPENLLELLERHHDISELQHDSARTTQRIWPWCRTTAWKHVRRVMRSAELSGPNASPKGLRHSFGVTALQKGVPLNLVQRWLGHSRLSTTAIYADASGEEERSIATRFWKSFD